MLKNTLKRAVLQTPLFVPVRDAYRTIFNLRAKRALVELSGFYSRFFVPFETVFDVGALQGEYSEALALGQAKVIAIEPNPAYHPRLTSLARWYNDRLCSITNEFCAAGEFEGSADLNVCSNPLYSTLLPATSDWLTGPDYEGVHWTRKVTVPVHTLDTIAEKHGQPSFVKIDVEGFEFQVLRGMSFKPRNLSFEFGSRRKSLAIDCISLLGSRGYRFNPIIGRELRLQSTRWMTEAEAKAWIDSIVPEVVEYGDMFASRSYV